MFSNNLTMMTDLYELTMMQGYFFEGNNDTVVFDVFYRKNPSGSAYAIACGLDQVIDYIKNLSFSYEDIDYLRGLGIFKEDFLSYLAGFHFSGDIYAIPEGSVVFPKEPLVKVIAPIMEAQLVETAILNIRVLSQQRLLVLTMLLAAVSWNLVFVVHKDQMPEHSVQELPLSVDVPELLTYLPENFTAFLYREHMHIAGS